MDPWIAEDKLQHFTMSFAAVTMAYGGSRLFAGPDAALAVAGGAGLALGVGKEVVDTRSGRWFSLKDLVWDAAGVGLGLAFTNLIQ